MNENKTCSHCKKLLSLDCFHSNKGCSDGLHNMCKKCRSTQPLQKTFGLSLQQYDNMLEQQNGCCYICNEPETRKFNGVVARLCVDHCHTTGKIRALLCNRCNRVLGYVRDKESLLEKMSNYLKKFKGE